MRRKPTRKAAHAALLRAHRHLYDKLLAQQGGGCAICGRPPAKRRLDMDHDHRSMEIRGLLCVRCNRTLPSWITPEWLSAAHDYLQDTPYQRLLEETEEEID